MEQWGNIQDVKELAIMVGLVTTQKLGTDLQLVVNLVVGCFIIWGEIQIVSSTYNMYYYHKESCYE